MQRPQDKQNLTKPPIPKRGTRLSHSQSAAGIDVGVRRVVNRSWTDRWRARCVAIIASIKDAINGTIFNGVYIQRAPTPARAASPSLHRLLHGWPRLRLAALDGHLQSIQGGSKKGNALPHYQWMEFNQCSQQKFYFFYISGHNRSLPIDFFSYSCYRVQKKHYNN